MSKLDELERQYAETKEKYEHANNVNQEMIKMISKIDDVKENDIYIMSSTHQTHFLSKDLQEQIKKLLLEEYNQQLHELNDEMDKI